MMHSRTLVLITLFSIFLTVFLVLRIMDSAKSVVELSNVPAEEVVPEIVTTPPIVPSPVEPTPDLIQFPEELPPNEVSAVEPSPATVLPSQVKGDGCYVGGCSGQVCSEQQDVMTTCEWSAEYACYKTTVCERQSTGDCGWTETTELNSCLRDAKLNPDSGLQVQ